MAQSTVVILQAVRMMKRTLECTRVQCSDRQTVHDRDANAQSTTSMAVKSLATGKKPSCLLYVDRNTLSVRQSATRNTRRVAQRNTKRAADHERTILGMQQSRTILGIQQSRTILGMQQSQRALRCITGSRDTQHLVQPCSAQLCRAPRVARHAPSRWSMPRTASTQ